jgi:hypothetical protein
MRFLFLAEQRAHVLVRFKAAEHVTEQPLPRAPEQLQVLTC